MAIDDSTNYTLTGAQVKDLVARIKAGGGGGMIVYVDASFASPSSITGVFSDSALTMPADPDAMADTISAGSTVAVIYDGGQTQEFIELSSVNSSSRLPEIGHTFTSAISTSAVFSAPTVVTLLYEGNSGSWSVETTVVPTKTSDITNDGADGTSSYVEADELATVATSGSYNDLSNKPTIPAAQVNSDWNSTSGVSQILNRPGIKNATAATHTDYNNNQDYLPNMRFLSFWNGAYNSSGNSNISHLASNAVQTSNINNSAVTTDKINGSAVTKAKMHGMPCPDYGTTTTNWGTISATSSKTASADGFVVGKAIVSGADRYAYVSIGGLQVGGIPYTGTNVSNFQVAFCIPVKSGTSISFTCSSGDSFQGCRLLGWQM